jgi:hypothetical protein
MFPILLPLAAGPDNVACAAVSLVGLADIAGSYFLNPLRPPLLPGVFETKKGTLGS